jgi:hypothetical protein
MNKTLFILAFCITFNFVFSQTTEKITEIRKCVKIINSEKNYQLKKLDNDYFTDVKNAATDNGQELIAYYKEGNLKKIVYALGLSNCMQTNEYYFDKGNLIFVYEQTRAYITPNELTLNPFLKGDIILMKCNFFKQN